MDLGNTRTSSRSALHQPLSFFASKADTEDLLDTPAAEVLSDDLLDITPLVLRRIVKHPRKHLLELGRQDSALHSDSLTDLEVKPAIGAEQFE